MATQEEKRWKAEQDARTLADAQRIKEDKPRLNAAKQVAKENIEDMNKVLGNAPPKIAPVRPAETLRPTERRPMFGQDQ